MVATDHKPLLKLLGDRKLEDIANPRLVNLKEKTLRWKVDIIHVPGKIHFGRDTLSRREVTAALIHLVEDSKEDSRERTRDMEAGLEAMVASAMPNPISWQQLREAVGRDKTMTLLAE